MPIKRIETYNSKGEDVTIWDCGYGHSHRTETRAKACIALHGKGSTPSKKEPFLPTEADKEELNKMIAAGDSKGEICRTFELPCTTMARAFGPLYTEYTPPRGRRADTSRDKDMCERWVRGETLETIGAVYNVTRERVRQILKRYNHNAQTGGQHVAAERKRKLKAERIRARREKTAQREYGIDYKTLVALKNKYGSDLANYYRVQSTHVKSGKYPYKPGIKWKINFKEYCDIWLKYGLKPRTKGFCFARKDVTKDFTVDNIQIMPKHEFHYRIAITWGWGTEHQEKLGSKQKATVKNKK